MALDPGERLIQTLNSIFSQDYHDYEVIIKDGGSKDGSMERAAKLIEGRDNVHVYVQSDRSIYDGMNQAVEHIEGTYVQFLNCGDSYYDEHVLSAIADSLKEYDEPHIIYGDQYNLIQETIVSSNPRLDEYGLFRNVPCHQVCFYDSRLFEDRAYNIEYDVRADYDHFLYCVYEKKAVCSHVDVVICKYEGGGYSEIRENRKKTANQHRKITEHYMGKRAAKYRRRIILTGGPIRTMLAQSPITAGMYNSIKSLIYKR